MKKTLTVVMLGLMLTACGGSAPAPQAPEAPSKPLIAPTTPVSAPAAPAAPASSESPAPAAAPEMKQPDTAVTPAPAATADPQLAKLLGSTWTMPDGTELTFKDDKSAHAKGGAAAIAGPAGLPLKFSYTAGTFTVSALGKTLNGTWDGETLTVDGAAGTKKAQ
jgi:hypothetical protein